MNTVKGTKSPNVVEITAPITKVKGTVKITDISIPFISMVGLMFKIGIAAIPVFIVLSFLWYSLNKMLGL